MNSPATTSEGRRRIAKAQEDKIYSLPIDILCRRKKKIKGIHSCYHLIIAIFLTLAMMRLAGIRRGKAEGDHRVASKMYLSSLNSQ
jgi:hypothetical protein